MPISAIGLGWYVNIVIRVILLTGNGMRSVP